MFLRLLVLALLYLPLTTRLEAAFFELWKEQAPCPPAIEILIIQDRPGATIEVKGKYHLYDPKDYSLISTRMTGKRRFMQVLTDGLQWGEEFPGLHQLMIVPDTQEVTAIVDGVEYRGSIYVYDVGGSVGVVNEVEIEDYLQSILGAQENNTLPQEVLAAMAITVRTNAYYYMSHPKSSFWAINADKVGYRGYAVANPNSPAGQAVKQTRYLILSHPGGQGNANPFPVTFSDNKIPGVSTSKISLQEAVDMAKKGANAADILAKAFPGSTIVLGFCP